MATGCLSKKTIVLKMCEVPAFISEKAKIIVSDLLPAKSKAQYEKEYSSFCDWKQENGVSLVNEDVILAYLDEKSKVLKPPSLWSKFSMLKATLSVKENLDVGKYNRVQALLKRKSVGYESKKSKVLSRDEVNTFLREADDKVFLMTKVAVLIGICGACRREELHSLKVSDIVENADSLIVTLSNTKTNCKRVFAVPAEGEAVNSLELFQKYARLRPHHVPHDYFFVAYRNQKCTIQRVGVHSFGKMPAVIAEYLRLPNPELYTGHCFRRTAASLVADTGAELVTLKRLGGWHSSSVAESYIEDSVAKKKKVAALIMGQKDSGASISSVANSVEVVASTSKSVSVESSNKSITSNLKNLTEKGLSFSENSFKYAKNCNFHFHLPM